MNNLFSTNKRKAISELLEVINKGVELLATEYLDKTLYESFERYAVSTLKIIDVTFSTNYVSCFVHSGFAPAWPNNCGFTPSFSPYCASPSINSASALNRLHQTEQEMAAYKQKLRQTLQMLITITINIIQTA